MKGDVDEPRPLRCWPYELLMILKARSAEFGMMCKLITITVSQSFTNARFSPWQLLWFSIHLDKNKVISINT